MNIIFNSIIKSVKGSVGLWKGIQKEKEEIPLDKIQFTVEFEIENHQISHFFL